MVRPTDADAEKEAEALQWRRFARRQLRQAGQLRYGWQGPRRTTLVF